jgi:hypothetical protein
MLSVGRFLLNLSAFAFHPKNDSEPRFAAYHPLVSLGESLQRKDFILRLAEI